MTIESQLGILHCAELQIAQWEFVKSNKAFNSEPPRNSKFRERPVITISREPGCGGARIAKIIAQQFELQLFGSELVHLIAQSTHLSSKLIATLDEKTQSWFEDSLAESMGIGEGYLSLNSYLTNLKKVIFTIAGHGNAVILGRGASFLIEEENRLAIQLVAPFNARVHTVMLKKGFSEERAKEYISSKEKQQRLFIKQHFHADFKDPANYDIVVNTAAIKESDLIAMVGAFLNDRKREEPTAYSVGEWSAEIIP